MPSYFTMLVATVFVVSMSSSVSTQAPASAQSISLPSDAGHNFRSLRSSHDTNADSSTNVVSPSDENQDEQEERLSLKLPSQLSMKNTVDIAAIRLYTKMVDTMPFFFGSTYMPREAEKFVKFYRNLNKEKITPEQLMARLNIGNNVNRVNRFKKYFVNEYIKTHFPQKAKELGLA